MIKRFLLWPYRLLTRGQPILAYRAFERAFPHPGAALRFDRSFLKAASASFSVFTLAANAFFALQIRAATLSEKTLAPIAALAASILLASALCAAVCVFVVALANLRRSECPYAARLRQTGAGPWLGPPSAEVLEQMELLKAQDEADAIARSIRSGRRSSARKARGAL